jgi:prolipoprotein diacylglyceryltransferase
MVFGRRWLVHPPPRATTAVLLRRSRKLYLASVAVVALVGALTLLYVAGYCAFRIVDELLRVDPAAHLFGLRWNLLLAIAGTAIGLAWFAATQRGGQHRVAPPSPALTQR